MRTTIIFKSKLNEILKIALSDEPRSGRPQIYSLEVRMGIIAICLTDPTELGYEINYWQLPFIRSALIDLGVVNDISCGGIYAILISYDVKPWKSTYWLNSYEKGSDEYKEKVKIKILYINLLKHTERY